MKTQIVSLLFVALPWLAACSGADVSSGSTVTDREVAALAVAEPGAKAAEYVARGAELRLFGTQGEGSDAFATLADKKTWETTNIAVGQVVGRSLKLVAVRENEIDLLDTVSGVRRTVAAGEDISVRIIEHEFDRAAQESASHVFHVSPRSLGRVAARYGIGASCQSAEFAGQSLCRISSVAKHSVADRLDLKVGDLVVSADGQAVTPENLSEVLRSLGSDKSQALQLTIARHGVFLPRVYLAE